MPGGAQIVLVNKTSGAALDGGTLLDSGGAVASRFRSTPRRRAASTFSSRRMPPATSSLKR
jgi:hypothetical protein